MAGYVPVFDSVFNGTLCGKWPTLPVWLTILPMADKNGVIDMTPQAMSALTGWPIDLLRQALDELCAPDPESRSDENEGRRLELIDAHRSWGWRVVNHGKYREKARKLQSQIEATESGRDAERKRQERERLRAECPDASRDVPTRPAKSGEVRLSDADADADSRKEGEKTVASRPPPARAAKGAKNRESPLPGDFSLTADLSAYVVRKLPDADPAELFAKFCDQARAKNWRYLDWTAALQTYVRNCAPTSGHWSAGQYPHRAEQHAPRVVQMAELVRG